MIDRKNYENFLLLYVDNELTKAERSMVEDFAANHPDVQQELEGLLLTVLEDSTSLKMPGKEHLFQPAEWDAEKLSAQQQQLLMMADDELPESDRIQLEKQITQSPLLQKEWQWIQKTILPSGEEITMPGKNTLYKKEKTRVILFSRFVRIAAAAALIGAGWFTVDRIGKPAHLDSDSVVFNTIQHQQSTTNTPDEQAPSTTSIADATEESQPSSVIEQINRPGENHSTKVEKIIVPRNLDVAIHKSTEDPIAEKKAETLTLPEYAVAKNTDEILQATNSGYQINNQISANKSTITPEKISSPAIETASVDAKDLQKEQNREIYNADDLVEDDHISIAGAHINKQKIRNIYRSITRPISRGLDNNKIVQADGK